MRSNPLSNKQGVSTPCVLLFEMLTQWAEATLLLRIAKLFFIVIANVMKQSTIKEAKL